MKILRIESLGSRGDGVANDGDGPIHVPFTAPGDLVELRELADRRGGRRAEMVRLIEAGAGRARPPCRHFGQCGGCALQHLAPDILAGFPAARIATALGHHGLKDIRIEAAHTSPPGSRRRLALKALRTGKGVLLGFHARESHRIVDLVECLIARPALIALIPALRRLLATCLPERGTATVMMTETASGIDLLLDLGQTPDLARREALADFAQAHDLAALHIRDSQGIEPVAVRRAAVMLFDDIAVDLPPGGFVQATAEGEAALVGAVREWSAHGRRAVDLFAGAGTFSLPLSLRMPTLAVEGARAPLAALETAARRHGLPPARLEVLHRDLFRRPLDDDELKGFDIAVIDPPRAGAAAQTAMLARSGIGTIIAISCNPNSFARDARLLIDGGYRLEAIRPVDQFLYSAEVELAALFRRP